MTSPHAQRQSGDRLSSPLAQLRHRAAAHRAGALDQRLRAFPSWFLRIECDRCGKTTMLNEAHTGERRGKMVRAARVDYRRPPGIARSGSDRPRRTENQPPTSGTKTMVSR